MPELKMPTGETKKPKKQRPLFGNITETDDGRFEATFPGLYSKKLEAFTGTSTEVFDTREQAERAVSESERDRKTFFELTSLEKSFGRTMYRIEEDDDGRFRVVLPSSMKSETGDYVGTSVSWFDTWEEARDYYLKGRESREELTKSPLLELQTGEARFRFSDFEAFNPEVAPSRETLEIPASVSGFILKKDKLEGSDPSAYTYRETINDPGWEKKLFTFVSEYLEAEGAELIEGLGIEHLEALTPKQAAEVSTRIVVALTKYKDSDLDLKGGHTEADQSTALNLLMQGRVMMKNPGWEGNGVCRNFASMTKSVFEALKECQTHYSRLRDSYALYEGGLAFDPKHEHEKPNTLKYNVVDRRRGHAWNSFVTVQKSGKAEATIVDTTWAKRNLETKKLEDVDYTLTRMEPIVSEVAKSLDEHAPDKEEQLKHVLMYYMLKVDRPGGTGGYSTEEEETGFYVFRAFELIAKHRVYKEFPVGFVRSLGEESRKIAADLDISKIEALWHIGESNRELPWHAIISGYLKGNEFREYDIRKFIVKDPKLQIDIFDRLRDREDADQLLKNSPTFRVRMREVLPRLFIDFLPEKRPEDADELRHLLQLSQFLRDEARRIDPQKPTAEQIRALYAKARKQLKDLNPQRYEETVSGLDDYAIIKQFDRLHGELARK